MILTEGKGPQLAASIFHRAGIVPRLLRIVQVKSAGGFRAAFAPIAAKTMDIEGPDPCDYELARLPYGYATRPLWPLHPNALGPSRDTGSRPAADLAPR